MITAQSTSTSRHLFTVEVSHCTHMHKVIPTELALANYGCILHYTQLALDLTDLLQG